MYRSIQVKIWEDKWFFSLKEREKLVYLYLITSSHTNSAGIINVPFELISLEIGLSLKQLTDSLNKLKEKILITNDGIIYIKNFAKYQLGNSSEKFKTAIASALKELPSKTLQEIINFDPKILEILPKEFTKEVQDTLSIPYPYPTDTLSEQKAYPIDTPPITETVSETEQKQNIKNKNFKNFDFEKDKLKETETSQENVPSQSLITPVEISQNDPPTFPLDPPIEDDFTRDSNRIQTAYKRLFKYEGDTSCLVELLQKNPPRVILDIMSWASKYGMWERKSKTPQEFLANFNEIKDFKYQLELNDRMFQRGEMRAGKDGSINDPELLAAINKWVSTKKFV